MTYPAAPTSPPVAHPPGTQPRLTGEPTRPLRPAVSPQPRDVLPLTVVPIHYDSCPRTRCQTLTFKGTVTITVNVLMNAPAVTLNAVGLSIDRAVVDDGQPGQIAFDEKLGRATLTFEAPILCRSDR